MTLGIDKGGLNAGTGPEVAKTAKYMEICWVVLYICSLPAVT